MPLHPASRREKQDHEALAFRVEVWASYNMEPPVVSGFLWRVAHVHGFGYRTITQRDHPVLLSYPISRLFGTFV